MKERPSIPVVPWAEFAGSFRWSQGQHVSVIGATGAGKTTLQTALLCLRKYVVVIGTKPTKKPDPSLSGIVKEQGFERVNELPAMARLHPKVLLWPRYESEADLQHQRDTIYEALHRAFTQGGWCINVDEVGYLCRQLGLGRSVVNLWTQGRSQGVSVLAGTQRPAWVPRDIYGAASHLFFLRLGDSYDRSRIAGMGQADSKAVQEEVRTLAPFQFLYVDTITGRMVKSKYDKATDPYEALR